ncbi:hypothetical protein B0H14DRAFT_3696530 [Mycena olivaceomarginata]|nr:hypothetical protein B0H14DRAFT_3696530 [Mycena olivaceomarginata]
MSRAGDVEDGGVDSEEPEAGRDNIDRGFRAPCGNGGEGGVTREMDRLGARQRRGGVPGPAQSQQRTVHLSERCTPCAWRRIWESVLLDVMVVSTTFDLVVTDGESGICRQRQKGRRAGAGHLVERARALKRYTTQGWWDERDGGRAHLRGEGGHRIARAKLGTGERDTYARETTGRRRWGGRVMAQAGDVCSRSHQVEVHPLRVDAHGAVRETIHPCCGSVGKGSCAWKATAQASQKVPIAGGQAAAGLMNVGVDTYEWAVSGSDGMLCTGVWLGGDARLRGASCGGSRYVTARSCRIRAQQTQTRPKDVSSCMCVQKDWVLSYALSSLPQAESTRRCRMGPQIASNIVFGGRSLSIGSPAARTMHRLHQSEALDSRRGWVS